MDSIYYLNHPPNPWEQFMSGMTGLEGHPFFAGRGHHHGPGGRGGRGGRGHHHGPPGYWGMGHHGRPHHWGPQNDDSADAPEASRSADQTSEPTPGPSTEAENRSSEKAASASEPETDNDNRCHGHCGKGKFGKHGNGHGARRHGLGKKEFGKRNGGSASESESDGDKHGHGRCGRGKHGMAYGGPYGMGRGGRGGRGRHGPGPHGQGFHGPPGAGPFGAYGHGRGPHGYGRHGRGRHHGPPGANFGFLRQLAAQFGIPFDSPQKDVDFVPTVDVFDTPANYTMHVSLPGAKKNDLSIDYDADDSVLRLAGVVYRPGMSEELHQSLAMEERSREVGVFEREIRLGTREAPAPVSVDEITAKLEDGVLTVTVPKIEPAVEPKKKVVVEDGDAENEKDAMHVDEASVTMTPEGSDEEEDTREYVKIPVH